MIIDDSCSGLDILAREELLQQIDFFVNGHYHLIYITHHIEEITHAITHNLLIRDGKVCWENDRPWINMVH
ncbi:hypothetical protein ACF3NG_00855 [Aerococcaceae bacterium WGS1372]